MAETLRRAINPEVRILDESDGIAEYVASDESIDSYREIIRADGWRFDYFKKNAPFVDSHDYSSVDKLLGNVIDAKVKGKRLVETVQWANGVESNRLAQVGWDMTKAGFLKAVSVGFRPVKAVSAFDNNQGGFMAELADLGLSTTDRVRVIYTEQQQLELSSCILGANPNAVALAQKAYKAGVIDESDVEFLSGYLDADDPVADYKAQQFLDKFERLVRSM